MCGIAGFVWPAGQTPPPAEERRALLSAMTGAMAHRGPDADGHLVDGPVALGHRRLSIIDLTPSGAQPMEHASGRCVVTFNGEIYNYQDIRAKLEASFPQPVRLSTRCTRWRVADIRRFLGLEGGAV